MKTLSAIAMAAALAAAIAAGVPATRAESLVAAVSSNIVAIESNFTGSRIVLFGTVERDAQTVSRPGPYDVIVVVRGPPEEVVTWRKERLAGIWVNRESRSFEKMPSYVAVMSTRALEDIASPGILEQFELGLKYLKLAEPGGAQGVGGAQAAEFARAAVRLKRQRDLYIQEPYGVQFLSDSLFQSQIPIPANVRTGGYEATVYLLRDGTLLDRTSLDIHVRKRGFEQVVYDLAHDEPLLYGAAAVAIAIFAGWFAGVIFRR